jgi:tetratricopeptide (TPR) repeat protein
LCDCRRHCFKYWIRINLPRVACRERELARKGLTDDRSEAWITFRFHQKQIARWLFQLGRRREAKNYLDEIESRHPGLDLALQEVRFQWRAIESPSRWKAEARKMASGRKEHDLWYLSYFALTANEYCEITLRQRRFAMKLALNACGEGDLDVLRIAVSFYMEIGQDRDALGILDHLIRIYPDSYLYDLPEVWEEFMEIRATLLAKVRSPFIGTRDNASVPPTPQ